MADRVLIFGVNGFVGGWLTKEYVDHGYDVVGSDVGEAAAHAGLADYMSGNLLDADRVTEIVCATRPDAIVNLAAISSVGQSWKMPALTMQVNVVGTISVLEAALAQKEPPKILLVGSSEEYTPSERPLRETDPLEATNPYGISKVVQERLAELYGERYGLRIYRVRSFNHTGPGQSDRFVIPGWCKQAAEISLGQREPVLRVGNICVERDFSDVRDVVRAYRLVIEGAKPGSVYNIGSDRCLPLADLLDRIVSLSGRDVRIEVDSSRLRPSDNLHSACDSSRLRRELSWRPLWAIEDTLSEMFEDFRGSLRG